jgi:integrase
VPKRRFQEGCIRIVGKQWVLYYWMDVNQDGVIRRVKRSARLGATSALSSRAARSAAQPILDAVNHQTDVPVVNMNRGVTLAEFVPEWRRTMLATEALKPSTLRSMESSIRAHLLPILGDVTVTGIETRRVQDLIDSMKGRSRKTRENVVMDLFSILSAARDWHHAVPAVKMSSLRFPVEEPKEPFSFQPDHVEAILKFFAGKRPWDLFFTLLADSGLRASEILGLRVRDLDFDRSLIFVCQAVWHGQVQSVKTPSSKNSVPMTKKVKEKLKAYLRTHNHELLFVNRRGRPYSRNKIVQQVLHPALDALGIEHKGQRVGLHAFRHYVASMLLEETGPAVAQRQLRHSDARTTLEAYGHVIGDDQKNAMEAISMRRKLRRKRNQSVPIGTSPVSKTSIAL